MKRSIIFLSCCVALLLAMILNVSSTHAQSDGSSTVINYTAPPLAIDPLYTSTPGSASTCLGGAVTSVPMDCFTFLASKYGSNQTDIIVGRSPFQRGKTVTTVKVMIVPLIITIGSTVFDSTAVDTCTGAGTATTLSLYQNSPIFQNVAFDGAGGSGHGSMMNGVNTGTTTYNDANRRAEYWSLVGGSSYHVAFNVTTHSAISINSSSVGGGGALRGTGCNTQGALYLNPSGPGSDWDFYVQNTLIPSLGIGADTFPVFLMRNVVMSLDTPPDFTNCCVLGYHGVFGSIPGNVWTYSPLVFDTTGRFGSAVQDISVSAHEVGEWLDDPMGGNPTPAPYWGKIGQVGGCQSNWEVGDPLSGTNFPGILMPNGYTYHPQELAFWSWFYNGYTLPSGPSAASTGTGGLFSTNGTFKGASRPCSPGAGGTYPN